MVLTATPRSRATSVRFHELRASRCQHAEEIVILRQVADLTQRADVPFEIGLDVAGMPQRRVALGL